MSRSRLGLDAERPGPAYAKALRAGLDLEFSDVHSIAAELGLCIREEAAEGFDGALIRAANYPLGTIIVRASIRETGRKNFTIAHEIGHFVLPGHDRTSSACTSSEVANWADPASSRDLEREADEFASELLMPEKIVTDVIGSNFPSLKLIEQIAHKTHTSLSAAARRYCDLTDERCAIIWSTDGVQQWTTRSKGFPFFLPKGRPIQAGSFASACVDGDKVPMRPRVVSTSIWVDGQNLHPARIWEHSKALTAYKSVISLLWVKREDSDR